MTVSPLWSALLLSIRVSLCAMLLVLPLGLWAAWQLARHRRFPGRSLVETLLFLPLVLPPTVVGYGLLLLLGRGTPVGRWVQDTLHITLLFTWQGAAIAGAVMAIPLLVRSATAAFAGVDSDLVEAAQTLGASEGRIFVSVLIPLSYRGVLAGAMLAFARAIGEFGATLMVAGSIPGETETLSLALYAAVQAGDSSAAWQCAVVLIAIAFCFLSLSLWWGERFSRGQGERT